MRKRKFLSFVLSLMVLLSCFGACQSDSFELNFMSFNVKIPGGSGVQTWGSRKDAVMDLINNSKADIIGLQECSMTPYQDITMELAENYTFVYFSRSSENLAIIYDRTVFNYVSKEMYWLSDTPDEVSSGWDNTHYRAAAILTLEHKETGETIRAINTHGALNDEGNVKGFNLIAERSLSNDNDPVTVMCGDFNATPNKLGYVPIAEKLQDCRLTAKQSPNRDRNTWNNFGKETKGILDYCFVSKGDNVEVLTYQVRDDKFGENNDLYISDHFAVQATVRIRKTANNSAA